MWKPIDLRMDYILSMGGKLDDVPVAELKKTIANHRKEFQKMKAEMPKAILDDCNESLNALDEYYKLRLSKGKGGKQPKVSEPKPSQSGSKLSPTERYKKLYNSQPAQDFRDEFGKYDKKVYSRWLLEKVKEAEAKLGKAE